MLVWLTAALPVMSVGNKLLPPWASSYILDALPSRRVQRIRHISRTMTERSAEIVAEKRAALQKGDLSTVQQVADGKDIMSILRKSSRVLPMSCIPAPEPRYSEGQHGSV